MIRVLSVLLITEIIMKFSQIILYWENYGPMHVDRALALSNSLSDYTVVGMELRATSMTYDWDNVARNSLDILTLFGSTDRPSWFMRLRALFSAYKKIGRGVYFLCMYEKIDTLIFAWILRITGNKVFIMGDSKFDDYRRHLAREVLKVFFYYHITVLYLLAYVLRIICVFSVFEKK